MEDLEKWEAGFSSGVLVKPSSIEQIWTTVRLNSGITYPYGFGWYIETLRGHPVRRHGGKTAGFSASIALGRAKESPVTGRWNMQSRSGQLCSDAGARLPACSSRIFSRRTEYERPQSHHRFGGLMIDCGLGPVLMLAVRSSSGSAR